MSPGDIALRLGAAIVLEALAFVIWNVGTRSPLDVVRALGRTLRDGRALFVGIFAALVGGVLVCAAILLVVPILPDAPSELVPTLLVTSLVALAIEFLVGDDLRALATG